MQFLVDFGDVVQVDGLVEQHLVEWQRETAVQVVAVEDGQSHDAADEVEVRQMFLHTNDEHVRVKGLYFFK